MYISEVCLLVHVAHFFGLTHKNPAKFLSYFTPQILSNRRRSTVGKQGWHFRCKSFFSLSFFACLTEHPANKLWTRNRTRTLELGGGWGVFSELRMNRWNGFPRHHIAFRCQISTNIEKFVLHKKIDWRFFYLVVPVLLVWLFSDLQFQLISRLYNLHDGYQPWSHFD